MSEYFDMAVKVFDKVGAPAAILLGIVGVGLYAIVCVAKWGKPIAEQVVSGHLDFLHAATTAHAAVLIKLDDHNRQKFEKLDAIHDDVRATMHDVQVVRECVKK